MSDMSDISAEPWAYIAHKGSLLGGVTIADEDAADFLADFVKKGYAIVTVYSRIEFDVAIAKFKKPKSER